MKKKLLFVPVFFLVVAVLFSAAEKAVYALEGESQGSTSTRPSIKSDRDEKRLEARKRVLTKRAEIIARHVDHSFERFLRTLTRLEIIAGKIESRIKKIEERDRDLSRAKKLLMEARAKIALSKSELDRIQANIEEILAKEITKDIISEVRKLMKEAENNVRGAHRAIVNTLREVKASNHDKADNGHATTTATST